jgi:uncharacterized protein (DUF2384 family)
MINSVAQIRFPYHAVHISIDDDHRIHCFKYGQNTCAFDIFEDQLEASDWIMTPPDTLRYQVVIADN